MTFFDKAEWDCSIVTDCIPPIVKNNLSWKRSVHILTGLVVTVSLPVIHLGVIYKFWIDKKQELNRNTCSCSCWDTGFKGTYEEYLPGYKHFYFNLTGNTVFIWILTVCSIIACYESVKYLVTLKQKKKLRPLWILLFASSIYPHYYAWWSYVNAWNDDFYEQWWHQSLFTITELWSSMSVFHLCSSEHTIHHHHLVRIFNVALFHIIASASDQFVTNVILQNGAWHQKARDIGFMAVDVLHLLVAGAHLFRKFGRTTDKKMKKKDWLISGLVVFLLFVCSLKL